MAGSVLQWALSDWAASTVQMNTEVDWPGMAGGNGASHGSRSVGRCCRRRRAQLGGAATVGNTLHRDFAPAHGALQQSQDITRRHA